jgi:hypothetical protein
VIENKVFRPIIVYHRESKQQQDKKLKEEVYNLYKKAKQPRYTPWWRLGGE